MYTVLCVIPLIIIFIVYAYASRRIYRRQDGRKELPEPSGSWPVFGHLPLLGSGALLHHVFGAMANQYGPAFSVKLGTQRTLVISSWELVKDCFTTNDKVFASRPKNLAVKLMGYDHIMLGFAPYGSYWRDMRKLVMIKLMSKNQLELLRPIQESEINHFLRDLYETWIRNDRTPAQVDMKEKIGDLTMDIAVRMIAGKSYWGTNGRDEESRRYQKALGEFFYLFSQFMFTDTIPSLWWLDVINGSKRKIKKTAKELDTMLENWLREHRSHKKDASSVEETYQDIMDVLLSSFDETKVPAHYIDTITKANCLNLILASTDTTAVTLIWALSLLVNNREVLKKVQEEIDLHVGRHLQVEESDIPNLVYLNAVVKETFRLYPPGPLSVPRIAAEDCTVSGFHVPEGTHLFVNIYKLHRDPRIWSDPTEFRPERFMTTHKSLDVIGRDFEFIPFGSGRRVCPGIQLAMPVLHLTLARLLHGFELRTILDSKVDMTEGQGLSMPRATPLDIIVEPRLPSACY